MNPVTRFIKDILFPVSCVGCGREGEWLCPGCWNAHEHHIITACPVCEKQTPSGSICSNCRAVSALDGVTAFFNYQEGTPLARLIQLFKYNYVQDITDVWERLIKNTQLESFSREKGVVIPVPLYPRRERSRGFNQAAIIAGLLSRQYGWPLVEHSLKRERATLQQARLTRSERMENVAGAFAWQGSAAVPERVILVDDVFTTGATLQECARVLKNAGSRWVWGVTLARD